MMKIFIIHCPERFDRIPSVASLLSAHPEAKVTAAIRIPWEPAFQGAVRGSSLSHLEIALHGMQDGSPVLVLEDDAVLRTEAWKKFDISKVPSDVGVVMLGTQTEDGKVGEPDENGFRDVLPPNWGAHAVLYMPSLLKSHFFFSAFRILASKPIGTPTQDGLCYESILHMALQNTGLRIVRPASCTHTTIPSISDRTGEITPEFTKNLDL